MFNVYKRDGAIEEIDEQKIMNRIKIYMQKIPFCRC